MFFLRTSMPQSKAAKLAGAVQETAAEQRGPAGPRRLGTETRTARISVPKSLCMLSSRTTPI